jgi:oligoendopeptidase F
MTTADPADREAAVARYLDLLRAGGSDHPISLLQRAGVDFTTPEPVDALVTTMDGLVTQLENELQRIST